MPISIPSRERIAGWLHLPGRIDAVDRQRLLDRLPPIEFQPTRDEERLFDQASLARVLLLMVGADQESEYHLCRQVAQRALGRVPDPEEMPL